MKKIISVLVAVLLLCTVLPAAFAAETTEFSTYVYNMEEGKEYFEKGDTVVLAIHQAGAKAAGFKFTGFSYDTSALKMLGPDYDEDGWVDLWEADDVYKFAGKGVGLLAIGPNGISGGGTAKLTDRDVCYLYFEILVDKGTFGFSFSGAEADSVAASITGCSFTVGAPHKCVAGDPVKENEVAPTCTKEGSYDLVTYCVECKKELSRETKTVPALGHKAAEAVKENEKAATCTEAGGYDMVVYCSVCKEEMSREHTEIKALGHDLIVSKAPEKYDCDTGYLQTTTCSRCDLKEEKTITHEHAIHEYTVGTEDREEEGKIVTYAHKMEKCSHGVEGKEGYHGCSYEKDLGWEPIGDRPVTGDITPYIAMGVLTMVALISAAAYMLLKRKAI